MRPFSFLRRWISALWNRKGKAPVDQASAALNEARQLASEGKYEQALEKHIWFHDHALEIRPSYYGVRLSFALADWIELGNKYPKALETLRQIRDQKAARLLAGGADPALFHDVASIDKVLGRPADSIELFRKFDADQPALAASTCLYLEEALIDARQFVLARKYLGDPDSRFAKIKRSFENGMEFAESKERFHSARSSFEQIFTNSVLRLVTLLDKTGDPVLARKIQAEALTILDSPDIKKALEI
jgi:hypothetical protein